MWEFLMGIFDDLPPALRQRYFRHDRTPAHSEEVIWQWMNATNPETRTGRGSLVHDLPGYRI
jgi:hypothetical protein